MPLGKGRKRLNDLCPQWAEADLELGQQIADDVSDNALDVLFQIVGKRQEQSREPGDIGCPLADVAEGHLGLFNLQTMRPYRSGRSAALGGWAGRGENAQGRQSQGGIRREKIRKDRLELLVR
jgi:hypothetical protein